MENIPARNMNPPEERECPPCPECGVEMYPSPVRMNCITRAWIKSNDWYECHNPDCPECAKKYRKARYCVSEACAWIGDQSETVTTTRHTKNLCPNCHGKTELQ